MVDKMVLAIYGTEGAGKETLHMVCEIQKCCFRWEKVIFIDDTKPAGNCLGYEQYPYNIFRKKYPKEKAVIHIAVGEPRSKKILIEKVKNDGYMLESIIHPHAEIADSAKLGEGVQIKMGAVIGAGAEIGTGVWVQAFATVKPGAHIGAYSQISAKAWIGENAVIGQNVMVGMHAVVDNHLHIGRFAIVSMGSIALFDLDDENICMGNPGRIMAKNTMHNVYG